MRSLKTWRLFTSVESELFEGYKSESEVSEICKKYGIENWSLEGGLVNVNGGVDLRFHELSELPLKFGTVTGYFNCSRNNLRSLVGCPSSVGVDFYCSDNQLRSLVGCPSSVGVDFYCGGNNIREFTGIKYIGSKLYCGSNPISKIWDIISPTGEWNEENMELFNDLDIIQDGGQAVVIDRLNYFLEEIGRPTVEKVEGYINI